MKKTLFLGNGFDLALGLKTKYTNFFNDVTVFPFADKYMFDDSPYKSLIAWLKERSHENWFDIEQEILNYAEFQKQELEKENAKTSKVIKGKFGGSVTTKNTPEPFSEEQLESDRKGFEWICDALKKYVSEQVAKYKYAFTDDKYHADTILGKLDKFTDIFTFNYTNPYELAKGKERVTPYTKSDGDNLHYVHGSVKENDKTILGITGGKILTEYSFLYKNESDMYEPSGIQDALSESDVVVFFGHSLVGRIDYQYFKNFFEGTAYQHESQPKKIYILTDTNNSVSSIKDFLRSCDTQDTNYDNALDALMANCKLYFICTKEVNPKAANWFSEMINLLNKN